MFFVLEMIEYFEKEIIIIQSVVALISTRDSRAFDISSLEK